MRPRNRGAELQTHFLLGLTKQETQQWSLNGAAHSLSILCNKFPGPSCPVSSYGFQETILMSVAVGNVLYWYQCELLRNEEYKGTEQRHSR